MTLAQNKVSGVVLAGGQGRRMDCRDKGLLLLHGRPLAGYALAALAPLADELFISANRSQAEYAALGWPVIGDLSGDFAGPLAGVLAAMRAARHPVLLAAPCDSPLVETRHLRRLLAGLTPEFQVCVAAAAGRLHPVFMAARVNLAADLSDFLASGERKLQIWLARQHWTTVDFSDEAAVFCNVNTPEELAALQASRRP